MEKKELINNLHLRFEKHMHRHQSFTFEDVMKRLSDEHLNIILKMEETGGEPDFMVIDQKMYYIDMSKETPKQRVSLCYDQKARLERKKFPPKSSALEMANEMGVSILNESLYKAIQDIEPIDLKTSSWLYTPNPIRARGGALFGDRRYDHVFIYHNGAESYYGVRGFRGYLALGEVL